MQFHSPVFLLGFLPACVLVVALAGQRLRNGALMAASAAFYLWADWRYLPLMAGLIVFNYYLALYIQRNRAADEDSSATAQTSRPRGRRALLGAVGVNLAVLVFFKLLVSYGAGRLALVPAGGPPDWPAYGLLPLGLSYVIFQLISYVVDVKNEIIESESNFLKFAQYVLFFPKIVTGPITRYRDFGPQFDKPETQDAPLAQIAPGARRFIIGLAKKVLIADTLARLVVPAFSLASPQFSSGMAWLVVIAFGIQLYFDFSGYTDMAIGLGQMFGLRLPENFNFPYISKSIGEFWRRWHITLSAWFRDYVFYPLEFTRRREDRFRQQIHALVIFLLTGLWHGLTLNFALWGLIHGTATMLESRGLARQLKKAWLPLQHLYTLSIVILGWVFFRSPTPGYAFALLARMFGALPGLVSQTAATDLALSSVEAGVWAALLVGILFSLPVMGDLQKHWQVRTAGWPGVGRSARIAGDFALLLLLAASFAAILEGRGMPAIYSGF